MVNLLVTMFFVAHSLNLKGREAPASTDEPMDTQTVVSLDDYKHYDNCETPGECSAPCANPQIFHVRMCESWMCQYCSSDYCAESCKGVQEEFPTCRCKDWPEHKKSYSASDLPPPPPYAFHEGAAECPPGTDHVMDESECATIPEALNMRSMNVVSRPDEGIPKGCWAIRGRLYYNPHDAYASKKEDFHNPSFGVLCKSL